ncbi:MAG: Hsp70 family protein, partial [Anaerolineales bacterium]|nr:Hsp70 family protein [Anaerolineales bacterium]
IRITASTNLNESEIDRMVNEAKSHEADDQRQREVIEARNQADQLIYTVEKSLNELGDKLAANERSNIETLITELRETMKGNDIAQIRSQSERLQQASYAISQQLYQAQGQDQTGGQTNGSGSNGSNGNGDGRSTDEGVVEGEFEEM